MEYISSSRRLSLSDVVDKDLESAEDYSAPDSDSYDEFEEVYTNWEDEVRYAQSLFAVFFARFTPSLAAYEAAISRHLFSPPSSLDSNTASATPHVCDRRRSGDAKG
jgi:hypothetical protein